FQIHGALSRFRSEAHVYLTRLVARIHPIPGLDSGECRPKRLSHLTYSDSERSGEAAVQLHVQLGLLTLGRQPDIHRALDLFHLLGDRFSGRRQLLRSATSHFDLNLLLCSLKVVGKHRHSRATDVPDFLPQLTAEIFGADAAISFGYQSHVDIPVVHVARLSAERREGETDFLVGARDSRRLLSLDPRVREIRPWRSLESYIDLRLILSPEEARTYESHGG